MPDSYKTAKFIKNSIYNKWARPAALCWTLLIFILCFLPGKDIPNVNIPLADKWTHLILFAVFSFLWLKSSISFSARIACLILLASGYVGWIVEYIQGHFIPDRSQDNMDTLADITGSIIGLIIFTAFLCYYNSKNNPK